MDVIAMQQAGFSNAVASLGTSLTQNHVTLIGKHVRSVYLIYDSDDAGIKAALRAIPMLEQEGISSKIVHLEPYKDPDEFIKSLGAHAFKQRLLEAEESYLYKLAHSCDSKEQLVAEIVNTLVRREEQISRSDYLISLAKHYDIHPNAFKTVLGKSLHA